MSEPYVKIVIPGAPRGWQRTGQRIATSRQGKSFIVNFTPAETRSAEWTLKHAAMEGLAGRPPLDGAIDLRITAWFAVPLSWSKRKQEQAIDNLILPITKPDFDNIAKLIDGLKGVAWRDDCLVTDFHFYKRFSVHPRTVVEVRQKVIACAARDPYGVNSGNDQQNVSASPLVGKG